MTVLLPQFAIQMFPCRSETVPCGQLIPPCVKPPEEPAVWSGDRAVPLGANFETLRWGGWSVHASDEKPKLPSQMLPCVSSVIP